MVISGFMTIRCISQVPTRGKIGVVVFIELRVNKQETVLDVKQAAKLFSIPLK